MNSTPQAPNVWPAFRARDARALIDFLVEAFGFLETVAYEEDGVIHHAQLDWPEGGGLLRLRPFVNVTTTETMGHASIKGRKQLTAEGSRS